MKSHCLRSNSGRQDKHKTAHQPGTPRLPYSSGAPLVRGSLGSSSPLSISSFSPNSKLRGQKDVARAVASPVSYYALWMSINMLQTCVTSCIPVWNCTSSAIHHYPVQYTTMNAPALSGIMQLSLHPLSLCRMSNTARYWAQACDCSH